MAMWSSKGNAAVLLPLLQLLLLLLWVLASTAMLILHFKHVSSFHLFSVQTMVLVANLATRLWSQHLIILLSGSAALHDLYN
jgi:hypothetical protein